MWNKSQPGCTLLQLLPSLEDSDHEEEDKASEGEENEEDGEEEGEAMAAPDLQQLTAAARDWKGENRQSLGELWLGLLR